MDIIQLRPVLFARAPAARNPWALDIHTANGPEMSGPYSMRSRHNHRVQELCALKTDALRL